MTLTINQATILTLTIILFVGLGGLNAEGYNLLAICAVSAEYLGMLWLQLQTGRNKTLQQRIRGSNYDKNCHCGRVCYG
jgi:hypothetical protein